MRIHRVKKINKVYNYHQPCVIICPFHFMVTTNSLDGDIVFTLGYEGFTCDKSNYKTRWGHYTKWSSYFRSRLPTHYHPPTIIFLLKLGEPTKKRSLVGSLVIRPVDENIPV